MSANETSHVSSLPLPPMQYINQYNDENVRRQRAPRHPPPIHDTYTMFGNTYHTDDNIIRPLESQGIRRLYPQHFDRRRELKKLNHSLLVNFLDLLDIMVCCPESPKRPEKVEDITLLFIHMHHLINEFRPHQARETLRVMMELQKRQRIDTTNRFLKHLGKVQDILHDALENLPDVSEMDCKLTINTDLFEQSLINNSYQSTNDSCLLEDQIMCNILDNMQ